MPSEQVHASAACSPQGGYRQDNSDDMQGSGGDRAGLTGASPRHKRDRSLNSLAFSWLCYISVYCECASYCLFLRFEKCYLTAGGFCDLMPPWPCASRTRSPLPADAAMVYFFPLLRSARVQGDPAGQVLRTLPGLKKALSK